MTMIYKLKYQNSDLIYTHILLGYA